MERKTIGIDLGHCETTAAYPRQLQTNNGPYEVRRLTIQDKDQVVSTQVILTNEQMQKLRGHKMPDYKLLSQLGEIKIGNKLPAYVLDGEKFCYFKAAPKDFDSPCGNSECAKANQITHGMVMACFVFALVGNIFKFNIGDMSENERRNVDLLIGCPTTSDWTNEKAQKAYTMLIKKATNVHDVKIIPESRAAMFSSVENEKNMVSAMKGSIVFDFGSSTADCTYMLLGRKMIEFSWTLGASEIERQMALSAYQTAVKQNGPFNVEMASIVDNEDLLRAAKEEYYNGLYGPKGHPMFCSFEDSSGGSVIDTPIRIDTKYMQEVTGNNVIQILCDSKTTISGSWQFLCKAFFNEAKSQIEEAKYTVTNSAGKAEQVKCTVDNIVLTGGASKMDFIYEFCRLVFPNVSIHKENNPSHTVSNGLGWVAVSDENFVSCREAAKKAIDADNSCSINTLRSNVSNKLFEKICEIAQSKTKIWADKPGDNLSVRDLQTDLNTCLSSDSVKKEFVGICKQEINTWKNNLSATMGNTVNSQVKLLYSENVAKGLVIPADVWKELQTGALSFDKIDVGGMLKCIDLSSIARQIGKFIVKTAIWLVALALAPETFGFSILGGMLASAVADVAMTDDNLDKARKQRIRKKVAYNMKSKLLENKVAIMKDFNEGLEKQTTNYAEIVEHTLTVAFEIVTLKRFEM